MDHYLLAASRACQLKQQELLNRMDTWPLYPGYLDALPEWPESGLISDPYLEMTRKSLRVQHGATDASEASLGFAALFVALNARGRPPRHYPCWLAMTRLPCAAASICSWLASNYRPMPNCCPWTPPWIHPP